MTPTRRKYDLDLMIFGTMGRNGLLSFTIPPYTDSMTFTSICYPECMNNFLDEGIYVIGGIMHTHLLGLTNNHKKIE